MYKKLALATLFFLSQSAAYAGYLYIGPTLFLQSNTSDVSSYRGVAPRLSVGYDEEIEPCFYLAGEFFASPSSATIANSTNTNATNAKIVRTFGFAVIPSALINDDVRGFVRLGVMSSKLDGPNTSAGGVEAGLGAILSISKLWDMRYEYDYQAYHSVGVVGSIKSNSFGIGFIRRFE